MCVVLQHLQARPASSVACVSCKACSSSVYCAVTTSTIAQWRPAWCKQVDSTQAVLTLKRTATVYSCFDGGVHCALMLVLRGDVRCVCTSNK
jgi:hypothetical protein